MTRIATALVIAALALTACGRKGALERVEGTAPPPKQELPTPGDDAKDPLESRIRTSF